MHVPGHIASEWTTGEMPVEIAKCPPVARMRTLPILASASRSDRRLCLLKISCPVEESLTLLWILKGKYTGLSTGA